MPLRDDIIDYANSYLETSRFTDYAPIGLQIEGKPEVRRIAAAVSACMEVFEQAAQWQADMLIVHHGMLWDRDDRVLRGHLKQRIKFLLDHNITLAGYHLPLDAHPEIGNNALYARHMGFQDMQPFGLYKGMYLGWRGSIVPTPLPEFMARTAAFYDISPDTIRAFAEGPQTITSAAIVSGGAWDEILEAARAGVDCYVTGNADEPAYHFAKEEHINFLACGHHATERVGIRALGQHLSDRFGVEARFLDVPNPL